MSEFGYLVSYGRGEYLGRFSAAAAFRRGERVAVRTTRGVESGTVLGPATSSKIDGAGEILRPLTSADEAAIAGRRTLVAAVLKDAEAVARQLHLSLQVLDGEILLDGSSAIVEAVHWAECDATPLFEELSRRHGLVVKLADLTATPKPAGGCETCGAEKSGCDSCGTGGGCATGSCSKGSVKSAEELTAYFAGLRQQMEVAAARVSLH